MPCTVLLNHIENQSFKCSNATAVIHSENKFELIRLCRVK